MPSQDVEVSEKDVVELLDFFTKVPAFLLKRFVSSETNLVKQFEDQVAAYKNQLSDKELYKIAKVTEMPVKELQEILANVYRENRKEQLKILADPRAEPFITVNLQELKSVLFN